MVPVVSRPQGELTPTWWPPCRRATGCPAWRTARTSSTTSWKCAGKKRPRRGPRSTTCRASWTTSTRPRRASTSSSLRAQGTEATHGTAAFLKGKRNNPCSLVISWAGVTGHPCFPHTRLTLRKNTPPWERILLSRATAHQCVAWPAPRGQSGLARPTSGHGLLRRKHLSHQKCTHIGLVFTRGCVTQRFRGHFSKSQTGAQLNSLIKVK